MLWHSEKARRYYNPYRIEVSDANATRPICRTLPLYIAGHHQPNLEELTLLNADITSLHPRFFHHLADYRSVIELSMKSCTFRSAYDLRRIIEALQNTVNFQITAVTFKHTLVLPERLGEASIAWRQLYTVEVKDVHERDAGPLASVFLSLGYPIKYLQLDTVTFQSFAQFSQFVRKIPSLKSLKLTGVSCRHVPLSFMTNHAATELGVTPAKLCDLSIQNSREDPSDFATTALSWFASGTTIEDLTVGGPDVRSFSGPLQDMAPSISKLTMLVATQCACRDSVHCTSR